MVGLNFAGLAQECEQDIRVLIPLIKQSHGEALHQASALLQGADTASKVDFEQVSSWAVRIEIARHTLAMAGDFDLSSHILAQLGQG